MNAFIQADRNSADPAARHGSQLPWTQPPRKPHSAWWPGAKRTQNALSAWPMKQIDRQHPSGLLFVALIELRHSALGPSTMMGRFISN